MGAEKRVEVLNHTRKLIAATLQRKGERIRKRRKKGRRRGEREWERKTPTQDLADSRGEAGVLLET